MDGRVYALEFENQTLSNAGGDRDVFYIAPADDKPIVVIGWDLAQFSDLKDAEEEVARLRLIRGHTTVGSGGTAYTASAVYRKNPADPDPGFTARHNDTTIASAGTAFNAWSGGWNMRIAPAPYFLPEKLWVPCYQPQGSVVLRVMAAVADDVSYNGTIWVLEQG